jgi:DNA polymerase-3 subunit alpha
VAEFTHLHAHSTYSILDAWGSPEVIVERLKETGATAHALTDHDSISGHIKFDKAMRSADIQPLFGIEIRVVDDLDQRDLKVDGKRFYPYHLGIIAATNEGYQNLLGLTALAWRQGMGGRGKYMPVVTWDQIEENNAGLVGTSGCLSGKVSRAILGQIDEPWQDVLADIESRFEYNRLLPEWQNVDLDACREVASHIGKLKHSVVTHDVHFPTKAHREAQNIMNAIARYRRIDSSDGEEGMREQCYLASPDEVIDIHKELNGGATSLRQLIRSMENTMQVPEWADVTLPKLDMVRFPLPDGYTDQIEYLKDMIREGWKRRGLDKLPKSERKRYRDRLLYEFDIIVKKDFVDYFLIIADICHFCLDNDILKGPARGSSAGSLTAWLCSITEVNPLEHGLIFERFIDLNRHDLPDVDMDFQDDRREEIHGYLQEKYGERNVGYIGTFMSFKARNSLDDVTRVFNLPRWVPNKIKPYIPERSHGDVRSNMTLADSMDAFDEVKQIVNLYPDIRKAQLLEGQFRGMGVHPAGFVVASSPIDEVAPIYEQPGKGRVVGLDLYDAATAGLLKIDLLGLSAMAQIARARDMIREFHERDIDFYTLPLDDVDTMKGFASADVLGIFQFGGKATKNTLRQIRPTKFSELADINTLSRPGSMLAGTSDQYVYIHNGKAKPESIHPIVDRITADTHNLVLYQEQVLQIMREFGGLDWQTSSEIRKMMSKRMGMEILQQFWDMFVEGAKAQGIDEEVARDVWMKTSTFGAYGFNKSHSVSYAVIAYWQMYVKVHYPKEFYASCLATENDVEIRNLFIMEAKRKGVQFLPVHPNKSTKTFKLEPEGIRYGLTQIRGIGDKTADMIIEARPIKSREDLLKVKGIGNKTADMFVDALERGDDLFGLLDEAAAIAKVREETQASSLTALRKIADTEPIDTDAELVIAGHIISRNYRQEQKLSVQAKSPDQVGAKSDTVIVYMRDESGESFPCVIPGWVASQKTREIWEASKSDVYVLRGRLPSHGKFFLVNGLANTNWQEERRNEATASQLSIPFG